MFGKDVIRNSQLDAVKNSEYFNENTTITDALIEYFYNDIMSEGEKKLMRLVFTKSPKQEELDNLLKLWDIEARVSQKSLLLAYIQKRYPELLFTLYEGPRLKGLLLNVRFKNIQTIAHFSKIGKELNKNGITPVIIKGGAMKYLRPELPRHMGDIDIVVPEKDWIRSANLAKSIGYWYRKPDIHSIDIHESKDKSEYGILDIHRYIYLGTGKDKAWIKGLFERAKEETVFSVKALVPCFEDLMFITLTNLSRNLSNKTSQAGLLFALFDCKFFLENKPEFNWDIIKENAKLTNTEVQVNFAIKFINKISEDIIPKEIIDNMFFEEETHHYSKIIVFNRFYYLNVQKEARDMKIAQILQNPAEITKYIKLKLKYKLLKHIQKHPRLIEMYVNNEMKKNREIKSEI